MGEQRNGEGTTPETLLTEHRVAVAPGEGFGPTGTGWARISLATPDDRLELGIGRLAEALIRQPARR